MTILITGGTGYIGSHVAISLIDAGYSVVLFDNLSNSDISTINRLEEITQQKITFIEGDVRDTELISSILFENKIKVGNIDIIRDIFLKYDLRISLYKYNKHPKTGEPFIFKYLDAEERIVKLILLLY